MPRPVKLRLLTPEKIGALPWNEQYRVVVDGNNKGKWRRDLAPHTAKILETFSQPWLREIWYCGVDQSGKTQTVMGCMMWGIDVSPGDCYYLMPTQATSENVMGGKIRLTLERTPRLRKYYPKNQDDAGLAKILLNHGVTVRAAWSNSPVAMATFSAKYGFADEVDKFPLMSGKEASPIELLRKRVRTYRGQGKMFFASTPAGVFIYEGVKKCHQVWEYRHKCHHCGELIKMDADHLVLPADATPEQIEKDGCQYACNSCGVEWTESDRVAGIRGGSWVCVKGDDVERPAKVGFHHRAFDCLDVPLSQIAAKYLAANQGGVAEKTAWANGYEAEDYHPELKDRQEDYILRLVDPTLPRGIVPQNVSCLMLLVDTQAIGFFYQVVAYGYGRDLETWRIDHGYVEHFDHLLGILQRDYQDAEGTPYPIQAAFMDSGGGTNPFKPKHSRTTEVYEFCRQHPMFRPLKGRRTMAQGWNTTKLDFYPSRTGQKIPIAGGLILYTINVTLYKDNLAGKLQIEPGDPGAWHLHAEVDADFAKQLCAEYKNERGFYECPQGKANHHWDISVYALAAADIMGIKDWVKTQPACQQRARPRKIKEERW